MNSYFKTPSESYSIDIDFLNALSSIDSITVTIFDASNIDVTTTMLDDAVAYGTKVYVTVKGGTNGQTYNINIKTTYLTETYEENVLLLVRDISLNKFDITLDNIKSYLNITSIDYDEKIRLLMPSTLQSICDEINNDFIQKGKTKYIYDVYNMEFENNQLTITGLDIPFKNNEFFCIYNSLYNDGLYQISNITNNVITIDGTFEDETVIATIAKIKFPKEFLQIVALEIKEYINISPLTAINNVKREQVPDYEVEFFQTSNTDKGLSKYNSILNKYRLVYKRRIL